MTIIAPTFSFAHQWLQNFKSISAIKNMTSSKTWLETGTLRQTHCLSGFTTTSSSLTDLLYLTRRATRSSGAAKRPAASKYRKVRKGTIIVRRMFLMDKFVLAYTTPNQKRCIDML